MLKTGQELEIEITDFGVNGEGIGKYEGFAVFVEKTAPGDKVLAEVCCVKKSYAQGRIVRILEYSENRILPLCPSFGACGGCNYLHVNYETELRFKKKSVNDALKRIGGLDFEIDEIIGMDEPCFYRNKAVYHIKEEKGGSGKVEIGFYEAKTHEVLPVANCVIFGGSNAKIIAAFKKYMKESGVAPYDAKTRKGLVEALAVRISSFSGDIIVTVAARGRKLPNSAGLVYHLTQSVPNIKGITLTTGKKGAEGVADSHFVWGENYIIDKVGDYKYKISDMSFFQVNPKMTQTLYEYTRKFASLTKKDIAIDIYSGTGSISIHLSGDAKEVIGIELNRASVFDADENADLNCVSNVRFIQGDAASALEALLKEGIHPAAVILDPPRGGCGKGVIEKLERLRPKRLVYVSCNPATLARDLKSISSIGYTVNNGVCIDMFARCAHVETVIGLCRKDCL